MQQQWWKKAVVYQVYPRSFADSNGDGVGDLQGMIAKLDYLKELGVDTIWICPMYKSPQDDNGYDISDYQDIHHEYGTMADFDELLAQTHKRGMKLLIDLVVSHTSDEHPWFLESRSSRDNPKRDWYIWKDARDGKEPNNWESIFGGSSWEWDEKTSQYFHHVFSRRQPDLNWENRQMREAIYKMIRWWLDKGIDGFRIDAITHTKKMPGFPDMPNPDGLEWVPSYPMHMNVAGIEEYIEDLYENTFRRYPNIMTVGETNGVSAEQAPEWVAEDRRKMNMLIQFEHVGLWDSNPEKRVDLLKLKYVFSRWQSILHKRGWNALFVENHDIPRIVSKWGDTGKYRRESATAIATMYFLMEGTPFIYQGQELGMTNTVFPSLDSFDDISAKNAIRAKRKAGVPDEEILQELSAASRDNARTPMPWTNGPRAGFTTGKPWLPLNPDFERINVEAERRDPGSVYHYYHALIRLRREEETLLNGAYELVLPDHEQIYAYLRVSGTKKILVATNLTGKPALLRGYTLKPENLLLANLPAAEKAPVSELMLRPYEARVYHL
jgi:alpha-glucosidase